AKCDRSLELIGEDAISRRGRVQEKLRLRRGEQAAINNQPRGKKQHHIECQEKEIEYRANNAAKGGKVELAQVLEAFETDAENEPANHKADGSDGDDPQRRMLKQSAGAVAQEVIAQAVEQQPGDRSRRPGREIVHGSTCKSTTNF